MKVISSSVEIVPQEEGIVGMYRQIEKAGRVCYKSEGRMTENSYEKFVDNITKRGHWAVLEFGTIYLTVPIKDIEESRGDDGWLDDGWVVKEYLMKSDLSGDVKLNLGTRYVKDDENIYITTNLRVIGKLIIKLIRRTLNGWNGIKFIEKYWSEPTKHKRRLCTHWICSRSTSAQVLRHRCMSPAQESQRYCNYSIEEKFNEGVCFIVPEFIKKRVELYSEDHPNLTELNNVDLWKALTELDPAVSRLNEEWESIDQNYNFLIKDCGLLPEEARSCLSNDVKTEFYLVGYEEDFMEDFFENTDDHLASSEKKGFFNLRTSKSAQRDVRVLAEDLYKKYTDYANDSKQQ